VSFDLFINTSPGQLLPTHERKALFSQFLPETELDGICDVNDLADDDVPGAFTLGCLERCFKNGVYDRGEFEAFCREKHLTPFLDAQESWKAACLFFDAKQGRDILAVKMPPWDERDDAREASRIERYRSPRGLRNRSEQPRRISAGLGSARTRRRPDSQVVDVVEKLEAGQTRLLKKQIRRRGRTLLHATEAAAMRTVNPYFLHTLLEPITGLADDDDAVANYSSLNPNDEHSVREIIRELIVPHAKTLSEPVRERVKLAYRYYLSKQDSQFGRVFDSNLPPFDSPDDPRMFFIWMWEECFPGEAYELPQLDTYTERPDINEPLRLTSSDEHGRKGESTRGRS
jgi:hypothetical protein